jgi:hypothetical protein
MTENDYEKAKTLSFCVEGDDESVIKYTFDEFLLK